MKNKKIRPGIFARVLLYVISKYGEEFAVLGDFEEMYKEIYQSDGMLKAKFWCWKQILFSIPLFIKNKFYWGFTMFMNYLKLAFRNIQRHKGFSFINISGLAIGLAVGLLILLYVTSELTFDKHIENLDNKYRVGTSLNFQGQEMTLGQTAAPAAQIMMDEIPEVIKYVRLYKESAVVSYEDKKFVEEDFYFAEPGFFDMFSDEIIIGEEGKLLEAPYTVVLTQETALKYFCNENPVGKVLRFDDKDDYTVTGVVEKLPANTQIQSGLLPSFSTLYQQDAHKRFIDKWFGFNYKAYIELTPNADVVHVQKLFDEIVSKNTGELQKMFGASVKMFIQPVGDVYLYSNIVDEDIQGNMTYIIIFTAIAFFIILIACINFMNLSTARSINRLKEIGMRKVLGADRKKIVNQFLGESIFLSVCGFIIALMLVILLLPIFNTLIGKSLSLSLLFNWQGIVGLIVLVLFVGIVAGSYPAFYTSRFQPINALQGKLRRSKGSGLFRNSLVVFQFVISIGLITVTLVIYSQLNFIQNKNLGFDKDQVLVLPLAGESLRNSSDVFKEQIKSLPGVIEASGSSRVPGKGNSLTGFLFEGKKLDEFPAIPYLEVDYDFLSTLGMEMANGRFFSREFPADEKGIIINETLAKMLMWDDPIGKKIERMEMENDQPVYRAFHVIGVVKDFHYMSLHEKIFPSVMLMPEHVNYISAKLSTNDIQSTLAEAKTIWEEIEYSRPFEYFFLDDTFNNLYRAEMQLGEMFIYFTILAIFVSCLGLFGLATFSAEQRKKEVGIRKALGADTAKIILLLAKDFTKWVLVANVIAWPVAYYILNLWLEDFAYRIDIGIFPFILSGSIAILIALFTISFQTGKAAISNPVDTLKYE